MPPSAGSGAAEAIELAASAGLFLDPWQQVSLEYCLAENDAGKCAAFEVAMVVPRQNGKNAIVEAAELNWLFLDDSVDLVTHTAHRFDTSLEHYKRLRTLIETTPDLLRQVRKMPDTNGKESIELRNGKRLLFKARSKGGGRGFSGDRVVLDEAYYITDLGSLIPTMSARPDPQLWWTSSAPLPGVESNVLRKIIKRGRADEGLIYLEWSQTEDADLDDRAACAAANPSLGVRLDESFVWGVERVNMSDEDFARERFGIFPDPEVSEAWTLFDSGSWKRGEVVGPPARWIEDPVSFGVYVAADQSAASIVVAGKCTDGGKAFELVDHRPGVDWLVDRVGELNSSQHPAHVVINPKTSAGVFEAAWDALGVPVTHCAGSAEIVAHGALFAGVTSAGVRHVSDDTLDVAASKATARAVGDGWVINTRGTSHVLPAAAAALALWGTTQPNRSRVFAAGVYL